MQSTQYSAALDQREPPSAVLHVRGLTQHITREHLVTYFEQFAAVVAAVLLSANGQALVEMTSVAAAQSVVTYAQTNLLMLGDQPIYVSFSRSTRINKRHTAAAPAPASSVPWAAALPQAARHAAAPAPSASAGPGHGTIVRAIISKPVYPITVDVLTQLLHQFGQLVRMSIFHRSDQVHALIEFATADQAQAVIASTNGRDIYEGSCTVQAELSTKRAPLDVRVANERNRDFTKPDLMFAPTGGMSSHEFACRAAAMAGYPPPPPPPLPTFLPPPHGTASLPGMMATPGMPPPGGHARAAHPMAGERLPLLAGMRGAGWEPQPPAGPAWPPAHHVPPPGHAGHAPGVPGPVGGPSRGTGPPPPPPAAAAAAAAAAGPVLTLSNMNPERMTVQRIINLLCVFGNVVAVQRNTDVWTEARVEMEDARQARGTAGLISGIQLFGHRLQVDAAPVPSIPRQTAWGTYRGEPVLTCLSVPAGHLRRFASQKQFGNIYSPSRVLYLSNGPPQLSVAWLSRLFKQAHAPIPQEAAWFPQSSIGNPRKGCILRFNDIDQAVHALVLLNNLTVDGHTMKLAFTQQQWKPGRNMPVEPVPASPGADSLPAAATAGSPSWAAGLDALKRGRHEPEAGADTRVRARPRV